MDINLLKSVGFSDQFIEKLVKFDYSINEVEISNFNDSNLILTSFDSSSLIFENQGNEDISSELIIKVKN